jgi:hypothetical protein
MPVLSGSDGVRRNDMERKVQSPDEVRRMLGFEPVDKGPRLSDEALAGIHRAMAVEVEEGLTYVPFEHTLSVFKDTRGENILRCHYCGRASECCCDEGECGCVNGRPVRKEGREKYG